MKNNRLIIEISKGAEYKPGHKLSYRVKDHNRATEIALGFYPHSINRALFKSCGGVIHDVTPDYNKTKVGSLYKRLRRNIK